MRRILCVLALACIGLGTTAAQTVDPVFMYANMTTDQENPPVTGVTISGAAIIAVHVAREADGTVIGGAVDFDVQFTTGAAIEFVGLHIHEAAAGVNGSIVIPTDVASLPAPAGAGRIERQVIVTDAALLGRLLANPAGFYVNLHSTVNRGGVIRGQLAAAELRVCRPKPPCPRAFRTGKTESKNDVRWAVVR